MLLPPGGGCQAGQCAGVIRKSRLVCAVVLPKRGVIHPTGLPVRCAAVGYRRPAGTRRFYGGRVREARSGGLGAIRLRAMSLAVRLFAPTQRQHKPGARAKINTEVTRTKRHSPARDGTAAKMSV